MDRRIDPAGAASLLILAAVAWASARAEGAGPLDLIVESALLAGAAVLTTACPPVSPMPRVSAGLVGGGCAVRSLTAVLVGWFLVDGGVRTGVLLLDVVRVPALCIAAWLLIETVRRMPSDGLEPTLAGLVVLGTVQATTVLVQWAQMAHAGAVGRFGLPRAGSLLIDDPNVVGALLLATSSVTARALARGGGRPAIAALGLQLLAVLATGSRYPIAVVLVFSCGWLLTGLKGALRCRRSHRPGGRRPSRAAAAAACAVLAGLLLARRAATDRGEPRLQLWSAAWHRIEAHPWVGSGPSPVPYRVPGFQVTTHAHDEVLQLAAEYGLPAVAVALGLVALLVVLARRADAWADPWLAAGSAVAAGSGLVGYPLRVPVIALLVVLLVSGAAHRATSGQL